MALCARSCISSPIRSPIRSSACTGISIQPNQFFPRCFVASQAIRHNIPPNILAKVGHNLHLRQNHPLNIVKTLIEDFFNGPSMPTNPRFAVFDDLAPAVTPQQCFDELLLGPHHPSRAPSDTFYFDEHKLLRTHTSAHQCELMRTGHLNFLATGDCYRRDEIDASHYPVFHQMEGVRVWTAQELKAAVGSSATAPSGTADALQFVLADLKANLEGLSRHLFGDVDVRWVDAYFPFTDPSLELEVHFQGDWLETLGCGVIHPQVLANAGVEPLHDAAGARTETGHMGWAFGIGLERLAMVLFGIPDIRLFWSQDARFLDQFTAGHITRFQEFSKYPPIFKDVSFWLPGTHTLLRSQEATAELNARSADEENKADAFHENDVFDVIRSVAGDLIEGVHCVDEYTQAKTGRTSLCFRLTYRSLERTLTNAEIDKLQMQVRQRLVDELGVELR